MDFNQILQAMLNICNNACDAMPDGGVLSIEASETILDDKYCRNRPGVRPGKYCLVEIRDTGHGFDPLIKEKLFDPFFTTKGQGKGTGLGLSISLGIMQSHKGHIDIENRPGGGATARLYLPAIDPGESLPHDAPKTINGKLLKATILVVDDTPDFLSMLTEILDTEGFKAIPARPSCRRALLGFCCTSGS